MTFTVTMEVDERHWDETSDAYLTQVLAAAMADSLNAVTEAGHFDVITGRRSAS